jgi:hypothetical protein
MRKVTHEYFCDYSKCNESVREHSKPVEGEGHIYGSCPRGWVRIEFKDSEKGRLYLHFCSDKHMNQSLHEVTEKNLKMLEAPSTTPERVDLEEDEEEEIFDGEEGEMPPPPPPPKVPKGKKK